MQRTTAAGTIRAYSGFIKRYYRGHPLVGPLEDLERAEAAGALEAKGPGVTAVCTVDRGVWSTIPCLCADLERLRGIGPYTASAVLPLCIGKRNYSST